MFVYCGWLAAAHAAHRMVLSTVVNRPPTGMLAGGLGPHQAELRQRDARAAARGQSQGPDLFGGQRIVPRAVARVERFECAFDLRQFSRARRPETPPTWTAALPGSSRSGPAARYGSTPLRP